MLTHKDVEKLNKKWRQIVANPPILIKARNSQYSIKIGVHLLNPTIGEIYKTFNDMLYESGFKSIYIHTKRTFFNNKE